MTNFPATRTAFEVNTYDKEGNAQLHLGQFDSIEAAQEAIACHSGGTLDPRTRLAAQPPGIIETWPVAGVEYVVHVSPASLASVAA